MPWQAKDAAAHNSRLKGSKKLQKLWAATANKAVKRCPSKTPARGEPHGDQGRPKPPVRTVTDAPPLERSAEAELRTRSTPLAPASL